MGSVRDLVTSLGEIRGSGTAGGEALTTTAIYIAIPSGTDYVSITPRNLGGGAGVARIGKCPYAAVIKTQDTGATFTDYTVNAQDGSMATLVTLSSQGTAAQGDFFYVGSYYKFRGARATITAANGNASVITVKYWTGSAWADITATDGTDSAGASLGQTGNVTWTVPTDWAKTSLAVSGDATASDPMTGNKLYWTRWQWSAALDASVTINTLYALPASTNYAELIAGQTLDDNLYFGGDGGFSAIEALTDTGTGNLVVNFASKAGF